MKKVAEATFFAAKRKDNGEAMMLRCCLFVLSQCYNFAYIMINS